MMDRNINRGYCHQEQTRVKKRAQTQEEPRSAKVKFERGGGSQNQKFMCHLLKQTLWEMSSRY